MIAASLPTPSRRHALVHWLTTLCAGLFAARSTDWVVPPEALAYPPNARTARLLRNARCRGW
jgi:hypothetical protein